MRRLLNLRKHIEEISFIRYTISIHAQTTTSISATPSGDLHLTG